MSELEMNVINGALYFNPRERDRATLASVTTGKLIELGLDRDHGTALRDALNAWLDTDTPAPHVPHSAVQATGAEVAQQATSAPQTGTCRCGHDAAPPQTRHERYQELAMDSLYELCTNLRNCGHVGPLDTWSRHELIAAILDAEGYGLEQNILPAVQR